VRQADTDAPNDDADRIRLIEELHLYQAELEMQNEELRRAQRELIRSKRGYAELFEFAPVGYMTVRRGGKVLDMNLALSSMLGGSTTSLLGKNCALLFHSEDRDAVYHYLRDLEKGPTEDCEVRLRPISVRDQPMVVRLRGAPERDDGMPCRIAVLDVTAERERDAERRAASAQMERAHRLESLGLLAGGIAHDFNNLLTVLLGTTETAWRSAVKEQRPPDLEELATVRQTFERAAALTKQLMTFARGGTPVAKACSLEPLVREAAALATAGSRIHCLCTFPDDLRPVHVDPAQLGQVVHNVVLNAVQAMPEGGVVHLTAEELDILPDAHPSLRAGAYVQLVVRDNGPGIPAEVIDRVFDPYFTKKSGGSGLGLTIVHSIMRRHHGAVAVGSKEGEGTTFRIHVPISADRLEREHEKPKPRGDIRGRILVMDDEPEVRELFVKSLEQLGCSVESAENGERALTLFRDARRAGSPFQVVILDLTIVNGLGGKDTMLAIRQQDPDIRSIVVSGYSHDPVLSEPCAHGFDARLEKPFGVNALAAVVSDVLARPTSRPD
jgi:PAS domain S-box-containing protein